MQDASDIILSTCPQSAKCELSVVIPGPATQLTIFDGSIKYVHYEVFCLVAGASNPGPVPCTCSGYIEGTSERLKISDMSVNLAGDNEKLGNITGTGTGATVEIKDNTNDHKILGS